MRLSQAVYTVPGGRRLDGFGTAFTADGAVVAFAFDGGFGAVLFAGAGDVFHELVI